MAAISDTTAVKFAYGASATAVPATPSAGFFYVLKNGDMWLNTDGTSAGNIIIGVPKTRAIKADGTALLGGGDLSADRTITHNTASGYKHIPTGGATGNILGWSADGTAAWIAPTTLTVGTAATATTAQKVAQNLVIKLNGGTAEGQNMFTFNGSAIKNVNITASSVGAAATTHTHTKSQITDFPTTMPCTGTLTISGTSTIGTFDGSEDETITITPANIGAATASHTHANYVPTSRTINTKPLSNNITLVASDVGAAPSSHTTVAATGTALGHVKINQNNGLIVGSDGTLSVTLASATTGGTLSLSAQTIAGAKTFSAAVTVGAPTAANHATTKTYVDTAINTAIAASNAMVFKGTIGTGGTVTALPANGYKAGWTYMVITAGTYAGAVCEIGDMIICVKDYATGASNSDWNVVQTNTNGAVTAAAALTADQVVLGAGSKNVKALAAGTNGYVLTMVANKAAWAAIPKVASATNADHATSADSATSATTASKLSTNAGSATNPVYFNNGIPVVSAVKPGTVAPKAPGTATVGTSNSYAREDHVHPLQTTVSGNAGTATKLSSARTFALTGAVTGSVSSDLTSGFSIATSIGNLVIDDGDLDDET